MLLHYKWSDIVFDCNLEAKRQHMLSNLSSGMPNGYAPATLVVGMYTENPAGSGENRRKIIILL
jgi:hypothetical protein